MRSGIVGEEAAAQPLLRIVNFLTVSSETCFQKLLCSLSLIVTTCTQYCNKRAFEETLVSEFDCPVGIGRYEATISTNNSANKSDKKYVVLIG